VAVEFKTEESDLRLRLAAAKAKLLQARERRVRPGRDDKILADWNGLMIQALAFAGRLLDEARYKDAARRAARLVLDRMRKDGRLLHSYRDGEARHAAYLTDYADMAAACLDLYQATFETAWVAEARALVGTMLNLFWDDKEGGFFLTARDHEPLIARTRENNDGATPAGASMACVVLECLASLTGDTSLKKRAADTLRLYRDNIERFPAAFGMMLNALDRHLGPSREVVLAGAPGDPALRPMLDLLRRTHLPNTVTVLADPADPGAAGIIPLLAGKTQVAGRPAAYVCEEGTCKAPVSSAEELKGQLA
jgi:uncharacterized protein YyaL (SSP411 family)